MNSNELNLSNEVLCEIDCIKRNYEYIMCFAETKDLDIKNKLIKVSNSFNFAEYKIFRDAISDMWRICSWKKKFALYELSSALMNERISLLNNA